MRTGTVSERTIGRLSLYRRLLNTLRAEGARNVYSHELAELAGSTAAQVRRDLMVVGYSGSPGRGYEIAGLLESLREFLDAPGGQGVVLVGVGNLGKALLAYFAGRRPNLRIVAALDNDPEKTGRLVHGCRCYPLEKLAGVIRRHGIRLAVITVPASAAQEVADRLVRAGVRGLLNFAPVRLHVPSGIHIEDIDMTTSLEKVAYFAHRGAAAKPLASRLRDRPGGKSGTGRDSEGS